MLEDTLVLSALGAVLRNGVQLKNFTMWGQSQSVIYPKVVRFRFLKN